MGVMKAIAQLIDENREYLTIESHNDTLGDFWRFIFPNSWGVDIRFGPGSYGYEEGLFELNLIHSINNHIHLEYKNCVDGSGLGCMTIGDLEVMMNQIKEGRIDDEPDIYKEEQNGSN